MPSKTPPSGVFEIPTLAGQGISRQSPAASDHGQLWHAQTREGKGVVETPSPVCPSLRTYQFQLAQSGREMVRPPGSKGHPPRRVSQCRRSHLLHRSLPPSLESKTQTVRVDSHRRVHPGEALSLPPDSGADPAWLYKSKDQETKKDCLVICKTLH